MKTMRWAADAVVVAGLAVLALTPLYAAYLTPDFWIATIGGVVIGVVIAAVGAQWRWSALSVAAITVVAYYALGGALVFRSHALFGVVPTLDVLAALSIGAVQVWKQVLTLPAPFAGFEQLALAPFIAGLVVSAAAGSIALRVRRFSWALAPLGALLVAAIAFSTYRGFFPAAIGAAFAAASIGWIAWRRHLARLDRTEDLGVEGEAAPARRWAAPVAATGIVAVAALVGGGAAAAAAGADRDVLRDHVVPPLELHDYASPLTSFRQWVTKGDDLDLFTIDGLPAGVPVRLAALDLYDGVVYKVSGSGGSGAGVFSRVGRTIDDEPAVSGSDVEATVTVDDLSGVWVPTVGSLRSIRFTSDAGASDALHYNSATGTAVLTTGLPKAAEYVMDATVPAVPDEDALSTAKVSRISTPVPARVPEGLPALVDTMVADATTPVEQVRAVEAYFQSEGFFSHGLAGESRSGHSDGRETELISGDQMVGDDEQYSVAMALALTQLGIPVRVVMGFTPESSGAPVTVTGDDLHAWVEVPFDGYGWVAFHPTPPEDRTPQEQAPQPRQKPRVQVAQPPEAPQEPAELPPAPPVEEALDGDRPADFTWLWTTLRISGISLAALVVLLGPSAAMGIARARRRSRRSSRGTGAERVRGGWAELVDAAADIGVTVPPAATRREQAHRLDAHSPQIEAVGLATRADAAVFGAGDPDADDVARYWADVETARKRIAASASWRSRLVARLFPRSVIGALTGRGRAPRRRKEAR